MFFINLNGRKAIGKTILVDSLKEIEPIHYDLRK